MTEDRVNFHSTINVVTLIPGRPGSQILIFFIFGYALTINCTWGRWTSDQSSTLGNSVLVILRGGVALLFTCHLQMFRGPFHGGSSSAFITSVCFPVSFHRCVICVRRQRERREYELFVTGSAGLVKSSHPFFRSVLYIFK